MTGAMTPTDQRQCPVERSEKRIEAPLTDLVPAYGEQLPYEPTELSTVPVTVSVVSPLGLSERRCFVTNLKPRIQYHAVGAVGAAGLTAGAVSRELRG